MIEPDRRSPRRRLPPLVGFAILGFAVMTMAQSFDLPVDGRWWVFVGALAVLATISVASRWQR